MSGEKTRKLDTCQAAGNEKENYMLTRLSHNLVKLEGHAGLKKLNRHYENSPHSKHKCCT